MTAEPRADVSGHVEYVCPGNHNDGGWTCMFCAGGLSACSRCGAFEGAWPDDCPGEKMTADRHDEVYAGLWNFRDGQWRQECCVIMRPIRDRQAWLREQSSS